MSVNTTTTMFLKVMFILKNKRRNVAYGMQVEGFSSIWIWKHSPHLPLEEHQQTLPQAPLHSHPHFLLPGSLQNLQSDEKGVHQKRDSKNLARNPFQMLHLQKTYNYFSTWTQVLKVLRSLKSELWVNVYTVNLQVILLEHY